MAGIAVAGPVAVKLTADFPPIQISMQELRRLVSSYRSQFLAIHTTQSDRELELLELSRANDKSVPIAHMNNRTRYRGDTGPREWLLKSIGWLVFNPEAGQFIQNFTFIKLDAEFDAPRSVCVLLSFFVSNQPRR